MPTVTHPQFGTAHAFGWTPEPKPFAVPAVKFGAFRRRAVNRPAYYRALGDPPRYPGLAAVRDATYYNVSTPQRRGHGTCTIASSMRQHGWHTGNANGGAPYICPDDLVLRIYAQLGGDPYGADNGLTVSAVTHYLWQNGFGDGGDKLIGVVTINPADPEEVRDAIYVFNGIHGASPWYANWMHNAVPGGVIDPPDGNVVGGHMYPFDGFQSTGPIFEPWGGIPTVTMPDALLAPVFGAPNTGAMLFAYLTKSVLGRISSRTIEGYDWPDLVESFQQFGGQLPLSRPVASLWVNAPAAAAVGQRFTVGVSGLDASGRVVEEAEGPVVLTQLGGPAPLAGANTGWAFGGRFSFYDLALTAPGAYSFQVSAEVVNLSPPPAYFTSTSQPFRIVAA